MTEVNASLSAFWLGRRSEFSPRLWREMAREGMKEREREGESERVKEEWREEGGWEEEKGHIHCSQNYLSLKKVDQFFKVTEDGQMAPYSHSQKGSNTCTANCDKNGQYIYDITITSSHNLVYTIWRHCICIYSSSIDIGQFTHLQIYLMDRKWESQEVISNFTPEIIEIQAV